MRVQRRIWSSLRARQILFSSSNRSRAKMLTTFDLDEFVYDALRRALAVFLPKDTPSEPYEVGLA